MLQKFNIGAVDVSAFTANWPRPQFSLCSLFWVLLASACVFAGRASTRWGSINLRVQKLAFCDEIRGFGKADRIANPAFVGGEFVTLYLEVQNFSQKDLSDAFETNLVGKIEILDTRGLSVHTQKLPADRQLSTTRKHDHFAGYSIKVPSLLPGEYDLRVDMHDVNAGNNASDTIRFKIAPGNP